MRWLHFGHGWRCKVWYLSSYLFMDGVTHYLRFLWFEYQYSIIVGLDSLLPLQRAWSNRWLA